MTQREALIAVHRRTPAAGLRKSTRRGRSGTSLSRRSFRVCSIEVGESGDGARHAAAGGRDHQAAVRVLVDDVGKPRDSTGRSVDHIRPSFGVPIRAWDGCGWSSCPERVDPCDDRASSSVEIELIQGERVLHTDASQERDEENCIYSAVQGRVDRSLGLTGPQ